ncbi:MAG: hypothetical protein JWM82_3852 [Myxococcales bacterium]|nr:hypothetical protein [Myxococcales bacterium]
MSAVAFLAILVAAGEAHDPAVVALQSAAAEVMGAEESVRLFEVPSPSDAEALRVERSSGSRVVLQLTWRDSSRLIARLRLHAARTDRWVEREIVFSSADGLSERGRTLGYAIASMLPEGDPDLPLTSLSNAGAPPPPAIEATPGRHAVGLFLLGGAGLGGPASGVGGLVNVETFVTPSLSVGASLSARLGGIAVLDANELSTAVGVGGAWWPLAPTATNRLGLATRMEALLLYHAVSHDRAGSTTEWKGHALPGADVKLEGTWRLGPGFELLAGVGSEVAFGTIDITVAAQTTGSATIPALRAVAEAGVRARF